jgi:hypothetical protein
MEALDFIFSGALIDEKAFSIFFSSILNSRHRYYDILTTILAQFGAITVRPLPPLTPLPPVISASLS